MKLFPFIFIFYSSFIFADLSSSEYYEDAVKRLNNNDAKGAVIQLKNAIKQAPNMLSAHVLLGKAYLDSGELGNAQSELEKANELGADSSLTFGHLAKAYMGQAKYQKLLQNIKEENLSGAKQSEVLVFRGLALLELGQLQLAKESFNKALFIDASNGLALSGKSLMLLREGKLKRAEELIQQALKLEENEAEVWNVKASISHSKGKLEPALEEYGRVLELNKKHLDASLARIGIYLDLNKNGDAREKLTDLRNEYPYEPRAAYLDSILYKREGRQAEAMKALKESSDILKSIDSKVITNSQSLYLLAGMAFFDVKDYEQATVYLSGYIKKYPNQLGPRKLLASVYFDDGAYQKSIDTLTPALVESSNDIAASSLLSSAYLRNGQAKLAAQLLEKMIKAGVEDTSVKRDLAIGYIELGQQDRGIKALEAIYKESPNQQIGTMLAMLYFKQGEANKALTIAEQLVKKQPENLGLLNLLGSIQGSLGQFASAKQQFIKMAAIKGGKTISELNLGKLALAQGNTSDAKKRYLAILKDEPSNIAGLTELARLESFEGNIKQQIRWLEKLRSLQVKDWQVRLQLSGLYIQQKQRPASLEAALEAKKIAPKRPGVLEALARSYIFSGKRDDAKYIYSQMRSIALTESDAKALYGIAQLQANMSLLQDAVETLSIAHEYQPNNEAIQTRLVEILLQTKQIELAQNLIEKILAAKPKKAFGYRLRGDLLVHKGDAKRALRFYRKAFKKDNSVDNALGLSLALSRLQKDKEATKVLEGMNKGEFVDARISMLLTELYLKQTLYKKAAKKLESLLKQVPEQAMLLNNLANVYDAMGDKRALSIAAKAYKLASTNADINDTYGWLLTKSGQAENGLPYLREAHIRNSDNLEVRYHIAKTLADLSRDKEALDELKIIFSAKGSFPSESNARLLEKELRKE
ncbi:MAG: PEP-CTERM system TPR-repeat protein PrsT [Piscirickettsiaceae bacterium]|nr:MAG: PEP-CTERM system TPR-repeat protein PrsT [Piscirickettsiaceae bacterium]